MSSDPATADLLDRLQECEARYRLLADNSWDIISRTGFDSVIRFTSPACERVLGYTPDELIGTRSDALVHPDDWPALDAALAPLADGRPCLATFRYRRKDGAYVWIESRVQVAPNPRTGEREVHSSSREVTGQRRAEDEAHERARQLETLGDNLPDGAIFRYLHAPDGRLRCLHVSAGIERLLGVPRAAFEADPRVAEWTMLDDDRAEFRVAAENALARAEPFDMVVRHLTPAGVRAMHVRVAHRRLADGGTLADGVAIDVTAARLAEAAVAEQRQFLRDVVDRTPGLTTVSDRDGVVLLANEAVARAVGRPRDAIIGRTLRDLWGDRECAAVARAMAAQVLATGESRDLPDLAFTLPDGSPRRLQCAWLPLGPPDEPPARVLTVMVDVTARHAAAEAARESERVLRRITDAVPGAVYRFALSAANEPRFLFVSRGGAAVFGLPACAIEADARRVLERVHPADAPRLWASLAESRDRGTVCELEYRLAGPGGGERWVRSRSAPEPGPGGSTVWTGVAADVTAAKRAALEQQEFEAKLQETQKLESLGVLAGGIAHDFNNLLTGVLGNADLARHRLPPGDPAAGHLDGIERAARSAADLCQQLLAYAGRGRFVVRPLDVAALVRATVPLLEHSVAKGATLALDLGLTPAVKADATQLRQVVMNLVINASEALGGVPGRIAVAVRRETVTEADLAGCAFSGGLAPGPAVLVEVSDTGAGMTDAVRRQVFAPFFTTKFTGRGLGLAAVLGIVRGHGGAIRLRTAPGAGTTFGVLLPPCAEPVAADADAAPAAATGGAVLVIDDEPAVRTVTAALVAALGYEALPAESADAGVAVAAGRPDLRAALVDLTMPGADGEAAFHALRGVRPGLPVVLMSGYSETELTERFGAHGFAGFLQKPFGRDALARRLAAAKAGG